MFHQVNILSIYSNHPWSKNITIFTACLSTHWTAHIKMCYFQQVAILFHLTETEVFSVILPMWYDLHISSDSKSSESKWSILNGVSSCVYTNRHGSHVSNFSKRVSPKIHQHGASSCVLYQYDSNCNATSKWYYHYYLISFGMKMCITTIEIQ